MISMARPNVIHFADPLHSVFYLELLGDSLRHVLEQSIAAFQSAEAPTFPSILQPAGKIQNLSAAVFSMK